MRPSAVSICAYLREPIYFFSRRSTLIFLCVHLRISICEYLRELFFLIFFSRRLTPIYFSLITLIFRTSLCFYLRISA